jgi:hypothetical protein
MQINWGRAVSCAIAVPTAIAVLSGCGVLPDGGTQMVDGAAGPAGASTPSSATASAGSDASAGQDGQAPAGPTPTANAGCPAGGAAVPASADRAATVDLDGDKRNDTLWLAIRGNDRVLGVTTASGARFSTVFTNSAPTTANAVGGRLGDGNAVILLDFSQEAKLYAVTACTIAPTLNVQGEQYTFDEGVNGKGTGVGCPVIGTQGRRLVGYLAEPGGNGDGYVVTRTLINLTEQGTLATNGATQTVTEGAPESDSDVRRAKQIICGPGDRAFEPAG